MERAEIARIDLQKLIRTIAFVLLLVAMAAQGALAQAPDAVADLAARVNRERLAQGLAPYALNAKLTAAAQAHANDIAGTGNYSHTGSDGSTVFDRVARTGYGAYSWGRRLGENWAWYHDAATAMAFWMSSPPHRANILHALYREIGIGIAPSQGNTVFVIDFGAQPNVLPVLIDAGASETRALTVTLALSNEDVMPNGDGAGTLGRATQVEISNTPEFAGAVWQAYAPQLAWTLAPGGGAKTVYVKYRDAQGRTATASDSISYSVPVTPTLRPTATRTRTPRPSATATVTATETPTLAPSQTATPELTPTETISATVTATVASDSPTALAAATPAVLDSPAAQQFDSVALGAFGLVVMLAVLIAVGYFARRT